MILEIPKLARCPRLSMLIGLLVLCGALAGCAVGPDYLRPSADLPDVWHQKLIDGLASGDGNLETWWTVLDDPVLLGLIESAGQGNQDLRLAIARVEEARARRGIAAGEWFPDVNGAAAYARQQSSGEVLPAPFGGFPMNFYDTGLSATWEIDLFGRLRRSVESSDADLDAAIEDYRDVLVVLYAELATEYVQVRAVQERITYAENNVANQQETLELVRVRNRVGLVGDLDVRQAELNVARTSAFVPSLRQGLTASLNRVATLIGTTPEELPASLRAIAPIPAATQDALVPIPAELIRQRPDLRAAERELAAQTARIGVAKADLYPRLRVLGSFNLTATSSANWFEGGAQAWGIGPSLSWNIFDGGRVRSNVAAQEALTSQAVASYEQAVLLAVEDVETSLTRFVEEQKRVDELERSSQAAAESVKLVKVLYTTGLTDFQNVLDSERSLFQEQDELANSQGQVTQNLIAVYRALGGGWTPPRAATP
jgi:multidrug efflux system outer membrane protein